jgi:predicted metal-dependent hydrolase
MTEEDWQEFERGVTLFNNRQFWHAHEAWEQVWLRHDGDGRLFLQGLIQLAAAYHHLVTQRSFQGIVNNFQKAQSKLEVFQPTYLGISTTPLIESLLKTISLATKTSEQEFSSIDHDTIPKLQFHKPVNPDALVGIRSICAAEKFLAGAKLFNNGYYWEAHEAWEALWREEEGDGKIFAEAFSQMAAGYCFLTRSKLENVRYLFTKAAEKFHAYANHNCSLALPLLISGMENNLQLLETRHHNGNSATSSFKVPAIEISERQ